MGHPSGAGMMNAKSAGLAVLLLAICGAAVEAQEASLGPHIGAQLTEEHDSNVFRSSGLAGAAPMMGDRITTGTLLAGIDETYSREQLSASASVGRVLYGTQTGLDYTQQNINAVLRSDLPLNIQTSLQATRSATLLPLSSQVQAVRDVIATNTFSGSADFPVWVDWRGVLDLSSSRSANSSSLYSTSDLRALQADGGIRYEPSSGNHIDLVFRGVRATYPQSTAQQVTGTGYTEEGEDLRLDLSFWSASHILGHAGSTRHRADDLVVGNFFSGLPVHLSRDFAGPIYDLTYDWDVTGATRLTLYGARQIGATGTNQYLTGGNQYLSSVSKTFRIAPAFQWSSKLSFNASLEWSLQDYRDDLYLAYLQQIGYSINGVVGRKDATHTMGLGASWSPRRYLALTLDLHREVRDSNQAIWSYTNNVANLSVRGNFDL